MALESSMASTTNNERPLKKTTKCGSQDRISSLPDCILVHILSLLPTKYAIGTGILSTRWKQLWDFVPILDLPFKIPLHHDLDRFADFVDRVLLFHGSPRIQRFCLECEEEDVIDIERLNAWISVAVKRSVQELDVNVGINQPFTLPWSLFMCKTLEILKLRSSLKLYTDGPVFFPNLRVFHVSLNFPRRGLTEKLFCSFPVLEELFIKTLVSDDKDNDEYDPLVFDISTPSLKNLKIYLDGVLGFAESEVVVNAPILEYLVLQDDFLANYVLTNLSSLVKADINVGRCNIKAPAEKELSNQVCELFYGISNVKYLALGARTMGVLNYAVENNLAFSFPNVTHLELSFCNSFSWKRLPYLLNRMPNLTNLGLNRITCKDLGPFHDDFTTEPPNLTETECLPLLHLTEIRFTGFKGQQNDLKLVNYLLENAKVLDKMTMTTTI